MFLTNLRHRLSLALLPVPQTLVFFVASSLLLASTTMALSSNFPTSIDLFTGHFYKEVVNQPELKNKNVIMSALSADIVMAMVALGAQNETKRELTDSLCIDNLENMTHSIRKTIEDLNSAKGVTLNVANKVYVKQFPGKVDSIASTYRSNVVDVFKSEIQHIDFANSLAAASEINDWVENKTNHCIKDLIDKDCLDEATAAVLINAIYFKGSWAKKFNPAETEKGDFYLADKTTIKVDMMRQNAKFLYKESKELDSKIVVLPYEGGQVSMVIILPNEIDGLDALEAKLVNGTMEHLQKMYEMDLMLQMPKFMIETTINLKSTFEKLGAKRIFSSNAQLGEILSVPAELYVSEAIQKAYIKVDEEGAEAAAASGVMMMMRAAMPIRIKFIVNQPFYYIVKTEEEILFSGHLVIPQHCNVTSDFEHN